MFTSSALQIMYFKQQIFNVARNTIYYKYIITKIMINITI